MEFRILGPLYADAGTGTGPAVISQPLLQTALAVLLIRANRPCSRALLIEALWGTDPPNSPQAALRVCISRLRRSLGDRADRLESVGPPGGRAPGHRQQRGYMMVVRPGELDVDEFTDLVAQGQAELDMGNAAAAAASLIQALALWGDPPLPDLPSNDVTAAAIARLKNHHQAAADVLIDARLAVGEYEQVLGQLRAAVIANPGRERTCAQLMQACQALGMRKEALEVYQLARRTALEQQGAEPGPALAVLYKRILAEEMATDSPASQLSRFSGTPRLPGSQAPAPPADFTGRSREIALIADWLAGPGVPVAVVTGWPGVGKTAAAMVAALQVRERFRDGQLYAELPAVTVVSPASDSQARTITCSYAAKRVIAEAVVRPSDRRPRFRPTEGKSEVRTSGSLARPRTDASRSRRYRSTAVFALRTSPRRLRKYALVSLAAVPIMMLGGAGTALAAAKPAPAPQVTAGGGGMMVAGARTAPAAATPASAPQTIVGGGGWEYGADATGNCGYAGVVANDNGDGHITTAAQLISSLGAMVDGAATIIWSGGGKSGSKTWQPKGVDWISPNTNFDVPQHTEITILLTGYVTTSDGDDCSIENPTFTFRSS
jgi:DNA-binding SARP family transcriptional activator